jgi:transposase-like protein
MVAESMKPGASVAMVAQRYGVNANLLFTWRRQEAAAANGGAEPMKLVPVTVAEAEAPSVASAQLKDTVGAELRKATEKELGFDVSRIGDLIGGVIGGFTKSIGSG